MGKISNALKKVSQEREKQREVAKLQMMTEIEEKQTHNESLSEEAFPQRCDPNQITLKDKIDSLRYDTVCVAKVTDASGMDPRVVTYFDYHSPVSEQYRVLRTNIKSYLRKNGKSTRLHSIKSNAPNIFTVTSSLHSEGKTVTSVNLAVALAKDLESRVLLVDCDLRSGMVHSLLNIDSKPGLADLLASEYDYSVALHPTVIKNLFVIPRGTSPTNPSELLGSKKMRLILERLRAESLTHIIIDTPPIVPFTDAQVLGAHTDAVLLVVQAHRTQAKLVQRSKELIQHAGGNFLGFVLTQTDYYIPDIHSYYHYYRYHKHKSGNGKYKKKN